MNENAKLWVEALRSGEFKQTKKVLSKEGEHCCLGVACVLYQDEVGDLDVEEKEFFTTYDACATTLPDKVQTWLGLANNEGLWRQPAIFKNQTSLTTMNDAGASFEAIADTIEAKPELFASNLTEGKP